jgi:hypothetical protein
MHQTNAKLTAALKNPKPRLCNYRLNYGQLIQNKSSRGFLTWIKTGRKSLAMWQLCWMMRACLSCCECFLKLASAFSLLHPLSRTCLHQRHSLHMIFICSENSSSTICMQNLYLFNFSWRSVGILTPQPLNKSLPRVENAGTTFQYHHKYSNGSGTN